MVRKLALFAVTATALVFAAPAAADAKKPHGTAARGTYVPSALLAAAQANPDQTFQVIVQTAGTNSAAAATAVDHARANKPGRAIGITKRLNIIGGAAAQLTGAQILDLAASKTVVSITPDALMRATGNGGGNGGKKQPPATTTTSTTTTSTTSGCPTCPYEGSMWPWITGVTGFWQKQGEKATPAPQAPAIAIVDSGIDASNVMFGGRVVKQVTLTSLDSNSPGDGYGHGTFVAGLASGSIGGWGGASPTSKLVSLDVLNDKGMALTSDVIAAADWIYQNKDAYNIRVANFSLHSTGKSSFLSDPLDKAVERLWFSGVFVVAAAGNYGSSNGPSGVLYAPGNDPFVLTVGALDVNSTPATTDDFPAPWSAYGYTNDGFAKPELGAPGRFMIGAVPTGAQMPLMHPDRVIAPGFMKMSGTSFSAPIAAGAAADLLALHPAWTPDQVKGALMVSAAPISPTAPAHSAGMGELKLDAAALVTSPPNPNAALDRFLTPDPSGSSTPVFDAASWVDAASTNPVWDAASWGDASWGEGAASWGEVSWNDASWGEADASWGESDDSDADGVSWASLMWVD